MNKFLVALCAQQGFVHAVWGEESTPGVDWGCIHGIWCTEYLGERRFDSVHCMYSHFDHLEARTSSLWVESLGERHFNSLQFDYSLCTHTPSTPRIPDLSQRLPILVCESKLLVTGYSTCFPSLLTVYTRPTYPLRTLESPISVNYSLLHCPRPICGLTIW